MFLILLLAIINAENVALDLFTPFNLNNTATGYIINGTICSSFFGTTTCEPCTLIVDPQNNRMLYDIGSGGIQVITQNSSYIYNNALLGGCTKVTGWNYSKQVQGYLHATSLPGSTSKKARYAGNVDDVATCAHGLMLVLKVKNNIIITMRFDQKFSGPFGPGGSLVCVLVQGILEFDIDTLDKNPAHRNAFFTLPAGCATPGDYCEISYPPGNPCIISQKKKRSDE